MRSKATNEPNLDHNQAKICAKNKPEQSTRKTRAYKHYKRPAFVAAVLSRHAAGESGRTIARELGVTRETIARVLKQPGVEERAQQALQKVQDRVLADFDKSVEEARTLLQAKIPDLMRMAVNDTLEKRDRQLAHEMVKRAGVYPDKEKQRAPVVDNRLQIAIQTLLPQRALRHTGVLPPTIEAQVAPEPAPTPVLEASPSESDGELPESTKQLLAEMQEASRRRY